MNRQGFTLIEVILVIVILGVLATVAVKNMDQIFRDAKFNATAAEMESLARAIRGDQATYISGVNTSYGYLGDVGALPSSLADLLSAPAGYTTWDGPYIQSSQAGDYPQDAWSVDYIYSGGMTIQSTGSGSTITKTLGPSLAAFTSNSIKGSIVDANRTPPGTANKNNVTISVTYPDGAGGMATSRVSPSSSGLYTIGSLPVGSHEVVISYSSSADTVIEMANITPGATVTIATSFGVALW